MSGEAKEKTKEENKSNKSKEKVNKPKQKDEIDDSKENKLNKVIFSYNHLSISSHNSLTFILHPFIT